MSDWINTRWQRHTTTAVIDHAGAGDNEIVAARATAKIRVYAMKMVAAGTVTARFESGAGGTALTGQQSMAVNTGWTMPWNPDGWFETAEGESLNLELNLAVSVDGELSYRYIYQHQ